MDLPACFAHVQGPQDSIDFFLGFASDKAASAKMELKSRSLIAKAGMGATLSNDRFLEIEGNYSMDSIGRILDHFSHETIQTIESVDLRESRDLVLSFGTWPVSSLLKFGRHTTRDLMAWNVGNEIEQAIGSRNMRFITDNFQQYFPSDLW